MLVARYFLELIFLQAYDFESRAEDPNLQVDALLKAFFAKTKARNRGTVEYLTDTLKLMGQLGVPFRRHRDSGRIKLASDIFV